MSQVKPSLYTSLSPALLHLHDLNNTVVVIIDVLRATSTIATALYNGARCVIPVDSVARCIELGKNIDSITAGERDGQIAEGLQYGNSPFEYPESFIKGKTLVLTTTNGTKLLHMALERGAGEVITGSFPNLSSVCDYLLASKQNVILGCAAWKDKVNLEDTLFAGAVINRVQEHFSINCDSSKLAATLYDAAKDDLYGFMHEKNASHYQRLTGFGLEKDIRYCLTPDVANVLPFYGDGKLTIHSW
ncbi:2-phosphosulfolactate phosphatase [Pseudobacter ginsenosidimutans]|jgi:2-phosphosulfolactate phosphatase|uniref:Probable 2-phosphosulfolactate phosphatase n=1 Tax=Pseudobacter ginsenosidimutans TaxID=661488 RepID=A0A4Q7MUW0_9BACT|nr:2-phosphosulfolactate phosphatase [Pseudobacter ginsenosidimutans]QEC41448.1 2-phosphosulfolactate phosphatase [Pseudobacter ginsenosidimutans]RZS71769.1 2-phosphosulfolactate phosphatase [Pseudobacter ginsenosidimutans]